MAKQSQMSPNRAIGPSPRTNLRTFKMMLQLPDQMFRQGLKNEIFRIAGKFHWPQRGGDKNLTLGDRSGGRGPELTKKMLTS